MPPKFPTKPLRHLPPRSPPTILEVERKFNPTTTSLSLLRINGGKPAFKSHTPLGISLTHDVYFDHATHRRLFISRGIYVRQRNGIWEAKVRLGGDYVNSKFTEYTGSEAVGGIVCQQLEKERLQIEKIRGLEGMMGLKSLAPVANFVTKRESWNVEEYKVVVDETDFGCKVGEVELTKTVGEGWDAFKLGEMMDEKIERFMKEYRWAFPVSEGKVKGKLSAYFEWRKKIGR